MCSGACDEWVYGDGSTGGDIGVEYSVTEPQPKNRFKQVVVDLTPVLPGGANGGAKVMTLQLIRCMGRMAPDCEFTLLTSSKSHEELASLDACNVRRICIDRPGGALRLSDRVALRGRRILLRFLPRRGLELLAGVYRELTETFPSRGGLLRQLNADLLFSPFTAPRFHDPVVPTVSVVYDLQHIYYPQFFEPAEIVERDRNFRLACRDASRIVCISDYVRKTVLENTRVPAERVKRVHISFPQRLQQSSVTTAEQVLSLLKLRAGRFLLYPANFWSNKNHEMLLTAFGMYRAANPGSNLKLVLTGSPSTRKIELMEVCQRMGLSDSVVFPGYVTDSDLGLLMKSCLAV